MSGTEFTCMLGGPHSMSSSALQTSFLCPPFSSPWWMMPGEQTDRMYALWNAHSSLWSHAMGDFL